MRRLAFLTLATLLLAAAGCLEGGEEIDPARQDETTDEPEAAGQPASVEDATEEPSPEEDIDPQEAQSEASEPGVHALSYAAGDVVERTIPIEGAFGAEETCLPVGCAGAAIHQGDAFHHEIPLDPAMPADAPVRVTGEIRYDQETTGDVHVNLRTGGAEVYGARLTNNVGPTEIDLRLSSPEGNAVVLEVGGHAPEGTEGTAYSGEAEITMDPAIVPPGVPTGVPVPAGAEAIWIDPVDGEEVGFVLWDPSGEVVAQRTVDEAPARVDLSPLAEATSYAVQILAPSSGAEIAVVASRPPSGPLQPLATEALVGPAKEAQPGRPVSGTFESPVPPVAVGVYEQGNAPITARTGEDPALEIRSPEGTVMDRAAGSPATFDTLAVGGGSDAYLTVPGVASLASGTYEFQVEDHRDVGAAFGGFALVYANAVAGTPQDEGPVDPGWPPVDEAPLRPGAKAVDGSCTANFVFSTADNRSLYVGTNSHCVDNRTIGETVRLAQGQARGTLAYCSWGAIDGTDTCTDRDDLVSDPTGANLDAGDLKNDLALIRVDPAYREKVHPSMRVFGGPTGLAGPPEAGDLVLTYGNSPGRDASEHLKPREGIVREADDWRTHAHFALPAIPGDPGSPVLTGDGRALGTVNTLELETSAGIVNFEKALSFAERHMGLDLELKTWPADTARLPSDPGGLG